MSDEEVYFSIKVAMVIIFGDDIESFYSSSKTYCSNFFLDVIYKLCLSLRDANAFDEHMKENVYTYLEHVRSTEKENADNNLINSTILLINSRMPYSLNYYRSQLYVRRNDSKYLYKYSNEYVEQEKELVNLGIYIDVEVLTTHSEDFDIERFKDEYLPFFASESCYIESLNAILREHPAMFKNPVFYERMMMVLEESKKINGSKSDVKKILKRVNKVSKK